MYLLTTAGGLSQYSLRNGAALDSASFTMFAQIASGVLHSLFGKFFERAYIIAPDQLDQQFTLLPVFDFVEVSLRSRRRFSPRSQPPLCTQRRL